MPTISGELCTKDGFARFVASKVVPLTSTTVAAVNARNLLICNLGDSQRTKSW